METQLLILAAALLGGLTTYTIFTRINLTLSTSPGSLLTSYVGHEHAPDAVERFGLWLLHRMPSLTTLVDLERHRRWIGLTGRPPTVAAVLGLAALLILGGVALTLLIGVPILLILSGIGAVYPFTRLKRQANRVQRSVYRALPELTALMAAEMAAGNPPDKALERSAEWGGPLAVLMSQVIEEGRAAGRPIFGRGELPGALMQVVDRYDLPALRAFASQIDLAARKGAAGPELMEGLARTLIIEYKDKSLRQAESLENRLAIPSVLFFFLPFLFVLLAPLVIPLLSIL